MIKLYIGHDKTLDKNLYTMVRSVLKHNTKPVEIIPIQTELIKEYIRPADQNQSTSFSFSRFLIPYLNDYTGWALYMDSDMIFLDDIAKLWNLQDETKDVQVVQHKSYVCNRTTKFFNKVQTNYRRKNWSSVMLFNCSLCKILTTDYINTAVSGDLHEFNWTNNIGSLENRWNFLVDEQSEIENPAVLHYTYGTPAYSSTVSKKYADIWSSYLI
jgi:lipopolysaccharide biosynthesis glycosyltransferase